MHWTLAEPCPLLIRIDSVTVTWPGVFYLRFRMHGSYATRYQNIQARSESAMVIAMAAIKVVLRSTISKLSII